MLSILRIFSTQYQYRDHHVPSSKVPTPSFLPQHNSPSWVRPSSLSRFHNHTELDITHSVGLFGRVTSPRQGRVRDNTQHSKQTSMPPVGIEPAIPASERPQTARPLGSVVQHTSQLLLLLLLLLTSLCFKPRPNSMDIIGLRFPTRKVGDFPLSIL